MEPQSNDPPLIAIVGETGSGKSALALELASQFNGEIIAADSRTIYRGMDIGTAKPSPEEQAMVPHHLIDVVDPNETFSAADFKRLAEKAIDDIGERGKVPFLVGGTGLYADAVLYDFSFRPKPDLVLREKLQKMSVSQLQHLLLEADIPLPENEQNPRHLIRAYETKGVLPERHLLRCNTLIIGLTVDREKLRATITHRVDAMVAAGLIEEVRAIADMYGWDAPALQAPGYKAMRSYIDGNCSMEEAKTLFIQNDMQLAKRQRTWFKRDKHIHWICKKAEAVDLITTFLNKFYTA